MEQTAETEQAENIILQELTRASFTIDRCEQEMKNPELSKEEISLEVGRQSLLVQSLLQADYHTTPLSQFERDIKTNFKTGLTSEERARRLRENGPNKLSEKKPISPILRLLKTELDMFAILLWCAAIISFVMFGVTGESHHMWLALCLIFVNVFSGVLTFCEESKSSDIMKGFSEMIPQSCLVIEDGIQKETSIESLVVGDVVIIKVGMKCPADIRIFEQNQLKIDLSSFNGETEPAPRKVENTETNILRAENICYFTSNIMNGDAKGVVIYVGDNTVIGKEAKNIVDAVQPKTPIEIEVSRFVKYISILAITLGVLFFILGIILKIKPIEAFIFAVGIIVANVPEGLSLTITVALALAAKRLAGKKVLVKELKSVETLGSVSVICTDKTGTITMNQMTVSHTYDSNEILKHEIEHSSGSFKFDNRVSKQLINILALNSKCEIDQTDEETNMLRKRLMGDASEQGILRFTNSWLLQNDDPSKKFEYPINQYRDQYLKKYEIPFSSIYKFQFSIHQQANDVDLFTIKGAPERIMDMCDKILISGEILDFEQPLEDKAMNAYNEIASYGERVLGCAYAEEEQKDEYNYDVSDVKEMKFVFIGFVSLVDPPKENVAQAVETCYDAKIGITMITGDHHLTATAIAKEIGLLSNDIDYYTGEEVMKRIATSNDNLAELAVAAERQVEEIEQANNKKLHKKLNIRQISELEMQNLTAEERGFIKSHPAKGAVMTGNVLDVMNNIQLKLFLSVYSQIVFARTTPEEKLEITQCYQELGKITAVSGDGLNDAPALAASDIGVAMASGSEVAREAGNIILMDDSFSTIVLGVEEGRLIFENLKKAMSYTVTSSVPQLMPFILFVLCGFPNAMSAIFILLIDVVTDVWPAFALGYEKAESDIMKRPPRNKEKDRLLDGHLVGFAYGQIGCLEAICLLLTFMLAIRYELDKYFTLDCIGYKWSIFASPSHKDFVTSTLSNLITDDKMSQCLLLTGKSLPKKVKTGVEFADHIFKVGQTASFMAVVIMQFIDAIISRTRVNSLFQQGLFSNKMMFAGLVSQMAICCFFIYVPFCNSAFESRPLDGMIWVYPLPFAAFMFVYDELRKLGLRKSGINGKFYNIMKW